ncbi:uncharacterized protein LOC129359641 [Poeciliopsis prolifica]|uniref:uncharacterized protein LOC129359641 n=1 Tax=Poeciliopsis prolifica TaxID=188132 RepID=UPI0024139A57|nr:uncharacterized protein LOC129359641 [Poeciliopsis prolifica]
MTSLKAPQYDDYPDSERNAGMTYFGRQGNRCKSQTAGVEVEVFCFSRDSWTKLNLSATENVKSLSSEQKDQHLGSDVQGAQPAVEAPQEADIPDDSPGQEESLKEREAQSPGCVKKKENTSGAASVDSEVLRSQLDQARDYSSHAGTREDTAPTEAAYSSSDSLSETAKDDSQNESDSSSDQANTQLSLNNSDHEALDTEAQLEAVGVMAQQNDRVGVTVSMHKRKLRKGLKKLSGLSWTSRDRLAVYSDVFDDVCEGLPVFGRILREIKTEYDLYISHLMDTCSSQDSVPLQPFVNDIDDIIVTDKEVEGAEKGVCILEEVAKSALRENKRAQDELRNFPDERSSTKKTPLSRKEDSGMPIDDSDIVQLRKLQVLNVLEEIQHLEQEIRERMAAAVATAAIERRIKALQAETIDLIVSNDRLRTLSKDLQTKITSVLDREKPIEVVKRMLWKEIEKDLQIDSE